jgi:TPR repeat protein
LTAYGQRNYCAAAEIWTVLAQQGNAEAQFNLGVLYKDGIGVPQNNDDAILWLRRSSDQGHEHAGLILSLLEEEPENDGQKKVKY